MNKVISPLVALFFSVGALAECVNFAGRWTDVTCDYYGQFRGFEYTYPFMVIKQTGCVSVDFGPGEAVSEIGKLLNLDGIEKEMNAVGTIEANWLDASQQTLALKTDVSIDAGREGMIKNIRTCQYKIEAGKLIVDITRNESGYRWQSTSGARCTYSKKN